MSNQLRKAAWQPAPKAESNGLSEFTGWNLAGCAAFATRTRAKKTETVSSDDQSHALDDRSIDTVEISPSSSSVNNLGDADVPVAKKSKSVAVRGIFELETLKKLFEKHAVCPKCQHGLIATFPACCIASGLRLECSNGSFVDNQRPASADTPLPEDSGSPLIEKTRTARSTSCTF